MTKTGKIIYWIATVWLALGMLSTAIVQVCKSNGGSGGLTSINHLGYPVYLLTLLGMSKILGVIAVLIPKFPVLKEWAYAGFFFTMVGAVYSHICAGDNIKELFGPVLLIVLIAVSWYYRPADRKVNQTKLI